MNIPKSLHRNHFMSRCTERIVTCSGNSNSSLWHPLVRPRLLIRLRGCFGYISQSVPQRSDDSFADPAFSTTFNDTDKMIFVVPSSSLSSRPYFEYFKWMDSITLLSHNLALQKDLTIFCTAETIWLFLCHWVHPVNG